MMRFTSRLWLQISLVVTTLVVASVILWNSRHPPMSSQIRDNGALDYFATQSLTRRYINGQLKYSIQADQLQHWPKLQLTKFERPYMRMHRLSELQWQARAAQGSMSDSGSLVLLKQGFRINSPAESMNPFSLSGESLRIFPDKDYAQSSEKVTVTDKKSLLSGRGVKMWFINQRLLLLDDVNGIHNN
jgi:lipopolysaccharide export system protein LptC